MGTTDLTPTDIAALPWAPIPAILKAALQNLANQNQLNGVPPQFLSYIMAAESGPSFEGGGWNGKAGGWFGLEAGDGGLSQADITSQTTFSQQAIAASGIYAAGLKASGGDPIGAENYYQTGSVSSSDNGAGIFTTYIGGAGLKLLTQGAASNPVSATASEVSSLWHTATGWLTDLDQILSDLLSPAWWLRVGMGLLGVALFGVGLVGFISTTKPGQRATSDLTDAAKDAGIAAVAA